MTRPGEQSVQGGIEQKGGELERNRGTGERESSPTIYSVLFVSDGFRWLQGSGMMEGIIMVNQRTALRLLSSSLLCFRGRLTCLVPRSEPRVILRTHARPAYVLSSPLMLSGLRSIAMQRNAAD